MVEETIVSVKDANDMRQLNNLKKLKGHHSAYRIRIKDFRVGIFIEDNIVEFVRILPRKDIYNSFP